MVPPLRLTRKTLFLAALAILAVIVSAWLLLRGIRIGAVIGHVMDFIHQQGPWVFFAAMALMPAAGFPLLAFTITAGAAFGEQMGTTGVIAACAAAIFVNISLTYWLARHALRPLLEKIVARMGHKVPQVPPDEQIEVTVLLRITPGPPFFLQSYILGMAEIPFLTYAWISMLVPLSHAATFAIFGQSIMQGKAGLAITGASVLMAATIIIHLVRRHYAKRKG